MRSKMGVWCRQILQLALVVTILASTVPQLRDSATVSDDDTNQLGKTMYSSSQATSQGQEHAQIYAQQNFYPSSQLTAQRASFQQTGHAPGSAGQRYDQLNLENGKEDVGLIFSETRDRIRDTPTFGNSYDSSEKYITKTDGGADEHSENLKMRENLHSKLPNPGITELTTEIKTNISNELTSSHTAQNRNSAMTSNNQNLIIRRSAEIDDSDPMQGDESQSPENLTSGTLHHFQDLLSRIKAETARVPIRCCSYYSEHALADCSNCNLTSVPTYLPSDLKILLLSNNHIGNAALLSGPFAKYANMTHLWLDSNSITCLPDDAFEGLENLLILSLYNNSITLDYDLNVSKVFHPLNDTLETLIINRNTNDTSKKKSHLLVYPDLALSGLRKLTSLFMDGLKEKQFGQHFQDLKNLRNLTLAGFHEGFCNMVSLTNKTFSYLSQLRHLNISDCNLVGPQIETAVFRPLFRLESLDVSKNFELGIQSLGDIMYGLRNNSDFRYLRLQLIGTRFAPCIIVYKHTLRYFKNTGLEVIEAMDNEIENIEEGAIQLLPPTLKKLNLTNNKISFGAYWKDLASLNALENLHLDGYQIPYEFPFFFPSSDLHCPLSPTPTKNVTPSDDGEGIIKKKCICGDDICSSKKNDFALPLPPNLLNFTMHSNSLAYIANNITFCQPNKLQYADLSGNMFEHLRGPIWGLGNLRHLDLSSCSIQTIGEEFFDHFVSLENLNLYENRLGDCLNADLDGKVFDKLYNLRNLNISVSNLYRLNKPVFQNLINLEIVDLSGNRIGHFNFTISHMSNLRLVDLHMNSITSLPKEAREHIGNLLKSHEVKVDMRQNPIYCDCDNLDFLEWIVKTNVFGDNYTTYYCKYPWQDQPSVEMKHGYGEEVQRLRGECTTHGRLFLGVLGATLLLIFVVIGFLAYRFRWTLRYWFHAARLKISSTHHQANGDAAAEFEYDVFISYANEDVDFVLRELTPELKAERGLKLMIHGESFQVGRHITDNIYMAVRACRKTLVLVTRSMLASHWCTYELQMARMESISTGRNVLVFLFLEEIPTSMMSIDVVSYIKTSTYISYPTNPQHRQAFWNKLADDLRAR